MANRVRTTLGDNVARLRRERGLDQGMLVQASQVTRSTIIDIESGRGNPRLNTLQAIADALGVSLSALLAPRSATAQQAKSHPTSSKLIEEWSSDNIFGFELALSHIRFADPALVRKFKDKNPNSPLMKCESHEYIAKRINSIFTNSVTEAIYWSYSHRTGNFQEWCANIGERSEQLLSALGFPILPLERADAIPSNYAHRISPEIHHFFQLMRRNNCDDKENEFFELLISDLPSLSIHEKGRKNYEITDGLFVYLNLLRVTSCVISRKMQGQTSNFRPRAALRGAIFSNLIEKYWDIYNTKPKMTDRDRGPFGYATGWAMRILKLGACRLRKALDSGELREHRANPWLGHLEHELNAVAKLRRDTIARRMEQACREYEAIFID